MNTLFIAFLIVLFWVGTWGILDHFVQKSKTPLLWYSLMVATVIGFVSFKPDLLEYFA